jgi:signal peptidase I
MINARLRVGSTIRFAVSTQSMLPTLAPGDCVIVRGASAAQARVGEIVLIKTDAAWLAHRLIEQRRADEGTLLVTKGDNCPDADGLWSAGRLYGIITMVERDGQRLNLISRRARGMNVLLAHLSRRQWQLSRARPFPLQRAAIQVCSILLSGGARMVQWMGGFE